LWLVESNQHFSKEALEPWFEVVRGYPLDTFILQLKSLLSPVQSSYLANIEQVSTQLYTSIMYCDDYTKIIIAINEIEVLTPYHNNGISY
jgi:hypothetical protein